VLLHQILLLFCNITPDERIFDRKSPIKPFPRQGTKKLVAFSNKPHWRGTSTNSMSILFESCYTQATNNCLTTQLSTGINL